MAEMAASGIDLGESEEGLSEDLDGSGEEAPVALAPEDEAAAAASEGEAPAAGEEGEA